MITDWPQIEALRAAYFASRDEAVQEREHAVWRVCEHGGRIVGAYSYEDYPQYGQRWIQDFYATPDTDGKLACGEMWRDLLKHQRVHGYALAGTIAPDNTPQLEATKKRGFRAIGIIVLKEAD